MKVPNLNCSLAEYHDDGPANVLVYQCFWRRVDCVFNYLQNDTQGPALIGLYEYTQLMMVVVPYTDVGEHLFGDLVNVMNCELCYSMSE